MTTCNDFSELRRRTGMPLSELADILGYTERTLLRWDRGETNPRKAAITAMQGILNARSLAGAISPSFRFIDLFAGIGGLRRGFDDLGGKCVFTSEWNKYAQQTYLANYEDGDDHIMEGDITKVKVENIPSHDLLLAGFPCQPFSIAGVSKKNSLGREHGFRCNSQGTLFFDVARIINFHRPRIFVLENVKNLVNHDHGNTFRVIRETLEDDLGYNISYRVIDAKGFVPQHRERIFIVGFREPSGFDINNFDFPDPLSGPKLSTILHGKNDTEIHPDRHYTDKNGRVSDKYILSDKLWLYLQNYAAKHKAKGNGFGFGLCGSNDVSRTLSARYYKDGSEILIRRGRGNPRRLTPRECARLMGFDKPRESKFKIPVSDTQAYKQFGNAVVVPVVSAIARYLFPYLVEHEVVDAAEHGKCTESA